MGEGGRNRRGRPAAVQWAVAHFPWVIAGYFALQAVRRVLEPHQLGLDEAEQMVMTQAFAWGYGSQPPLYTWMQMGFFAVFGRSVLALALLKNLVLFLTFLFVFRAGERLTGDRAKAVVVTLSLFFIPQIAWESQRALVHTALAACAAAATLLAFLRLMDRRDLADYAIFGAAIGVGFLSKYNYPIFPIGLLAAALVTPSGRRAIFDLRMFAVSLPICAALVLPTALWSLQHLEQVQARVHKFGIVPGRGLISAWAIGVPSLAVAALSFSALCVAIYLAVAFLGSSRRAAVAIQPVSVRHDAGAVVMLAPVACLAVLLVFVLASGTESIKDRWLQPYLFILPLSLFAALDHRLTRRRQAVLGALGACLAVVAAVLLLAYNRVPDLFGAPSRSNAPFGAIAAQIQADGFRSGTVVAAKGPLAGSLIFQIPGAQAVTPEYSRLPLRYAPPFLLAWTGPLTPELRAGLARAFNAACRTPLPEPLNEKIYDAEFAGTAGHTFQLSTAILPDCRG